MKSFILILLAIFLIALTSALWLGYQAVQREKIRQLNFVIQDQQETMYRYKMEIRNLWNLKNEAWNELNRIRG